MSNGVPGRRPILETGRMETKDKTRCAP